jgi:uncharacterized membrane protein
MNAPVPPIPSSREFTFLGVTYGMFACGLFLVWPALIGLVLAYIKRHDVADTFLASHYRWLIRTFWWWTVLWIAAIAAIAGAVIPNAILISDAVRSSSYFMIPWSMIGAAVVGGFALMFIWLWVVYRLTRGALRLSDGRQVP